MAKPTSGMDMKVFGDTIDVIFANVCFGGRLHHLRNNLERGGSNFNANVFEIWL